MVEIIVVICVCSLMMGGLFFVVPLLKEPGK